MHFLHYWVSPVSSMMGNSCCCLPVALNKEKGENGRGCWDTIGKWIWRVHTPRFMASFLGDFLLLYIHIYVYIYTHTHTYIWRFLYIWKMWGVRNQMVVVQITRERCALTRCISCHSSCSIAWQMWLKWELPNRPRKLESVWECDSGVVGICRYEKRGRNLEEVLYMQIPQRHPSVMSYCHIGWGSILLPFPQEPRFLTSLKTYVQLPTRENKGVLLLYCYSKEKLFMAAWGEGDEFWATISSFDFSVQKAVENFECCYLKNAVFCFSMSSVKQSGEENKADQREVGEFISVFHKNRGFKILLNHDLNQA